jgi:hypothetical protein
MKRINTHFIAIGIVFAFFVVVIGISFIFTPHYTVTVISGESSVGTWMSGIFLVTAAVLTLVFGMQKGWFPWIFFFIFFMVLALDERFMFHEKLKEKIIFNFVSISESWRWIYELPVYIGSFVGAIIAMLLWRFLRRSGKILLLCSIILGSFSVLIDILSAGVFIEDSLKLLAEFCLTSALIGEVDLIRIK